VSPLGIGKAFLLSLKNWGKLILTDSSPKQIERLLILEGHLKGEEKIAMKEARGQDSNGLTGSLVPRGGLGQGEAVLVCDTQAAVLYKQVILRRGHPQEVRNVASGLAYRKGREKVTASIFPPRRVFPKEVV